MIYLRACIDECLRICPPIPMPLPRKVLQGGLYVDEYCFPAGTTVGVPIYALHHNDHHFPKPFIYDPTRWLAKEINGVKEDEGRCEEEIAGARKAFVPFSLGPRACIGKNIALVELYIGVARVLWLYNLRIAPGFENMGVGKEGEYKMEDNFVVSKEGPMLQFQRRI